MWHSLVVHFVRDEGAAGSNPVIPIFFLNNCSAGSHEITILINFVIKNCRFPDVCLYGSFFANSHAKSCHPDHLNFIALQILHFDLQILGFHNTILLAESYRLWYACNFLVTTLRKRRRKCQN